MKEKLRHIDDDLLVKYLLEETSPGENAEVEQWLELDASNQKHYDDFKLIWHESKALAAISQVDEETGWQKFRNRIHAAPTGKAKIKTMGFKWLKIAAMIVLIAGAAGLVYKITGNRPIETIALQSLNKVVTDTLPDHSIITLNRNSTLSYPEKFKGNTRDVTLQGEAFFSVAPDKSKPFIINVNDVTVKVVGTSFNIKSSDGNTEIIVETGIVEVIKNHKEIDLHANEKIIVKKDNDLLAKEKKTETLYNYYRTKEFECDNTPLWKLVEVLNQAYNTHIIIERKELRNLPLTTTFNDQSLNTILEVIRQTFDITLTQTGNEIILK